MDRLGKDRDIILPLAEKVAVIAALPEQKERIARWKRLNSLKDVRPLVIADEIPWHEMDYDGFLELRSSDSLSRELETQLRRTLYRWEHLRLDMVVDDSAGYPLAVRDEGYGVKMEQDLLPGDARNDVVSHHYNPVLRTIDDVEKIRSSTVEFDAKTSEQSRQVVEYLCGGMLRAVPKPVFGLGYYGPLDVLSCWMGVQELLMAVAAEPALVHAFLKRITDVTLDKLAQYENLRLLALNNSYSLERIGTGGLGYSDELPSSVYDSTHVVPKDMWGAAAAQVFSEVSPRMHEEFALDYECRYLSLFGLSYYGCCDPLHHKVDLLARKIPNLRKISMSPWADLGKGAERVGEKFVLSIKPNPAVFAYDDFHLGLAREELEGKLATARNHHCICEVIIKDISTVRYDPRRLWDWAEMTMGTVMRND